MGDESDFCGYTTNHDDSNKFRTTYGSLNTDKHENTEKEESEKGEEVNKDEQGEESEKKEEEEEVSENEEEWLNWTEKINLINESERQIEEEERLKREEKEEEREEDHICEEEEKRLYEESKNKENNDIQEEEEKEESEEEQEESEEEQEEESEEEQEEESEEEQEAESEEKEEEDIENENEEVWLNWKEKISLINERERQIEEEKRSEEERLKREEKEKEEDREEDRIREILYKEEEESKRLYEESKNNDVQYKYHSSDAEAEEEEQLRLFSVESFLEAIPDQNEKRPVLKEVETPRGDVVAWDGANSFDLQQHGMPKRRIAHKQQQQQKLSPDDFRGPKIAKLVQYKVAKMRAAKEAKQKAKTLRKKESETEQNGSKDKENDQSFVNTNVERAVEEHEEPEPVKNLPPKIKRKKNLKSEKHAGKSRGQADRKREDKRNESYRNAESCLKQLGDPVDSMNINEKKIHTLSTYYQKVKEAFEKDGTAYGHKTQIVEDVATKYKIRVKTVQTWQSQRGKHSKTPSPILDDHDFKSAFKAYVKENSRKKGEPNLTCSDLADWVNEELGLEGDRCYGEISESKKGIYYDGHERDDVVNDRLNRFIPQMQDILENCVTCERDNCGNLIIIRPEGRFILVNQDEKIHHSNDVQRRWWADNSMNFPPPKSQGRTVMTSDFVTILDGVLKYNDKAWEIFKNTPEGKAEIIEVGEKKARRAGTVLDVNNQGYYTTEKCLPDFKKAAKIIRANYSGKYEPVFLTDHSPIHRCSYLFQQFQIEKIFFSAKPENALNAEKMNVHPGGKQPKMRAGYYRRGPLKIKQHMVYQEGPNTGLAKGKKQDDLIALLSEEQDFQEGKTILQEEMESEGCKVIFGVKFHPEFMMVESCYRDVSLFMKTRNILGTSKGYVDRVLDSDNSVTPEKVQKYFLNTLKFMKLYTEGETGLTVKKKMEELRKKHRGPRLLEVDHMKKAYNRNRLSLED